MDNKKLGGKKSYTLEAVSFSLVANMFGKFVSIPAGIYIASQLGPSGFGLVAIVNLLLQYIGYLNLGMLGNLTREVPIAYGKKDIKEVERCIIQFSLTMLSPLYSA